MRPERLCQGINSNDTIGNRTRDVPVCSVVPQPTAPPRAPFSYRTSVNIPNIPEEERKKSFKFHFPISQISAYYYCRPIYLSWRSPYSRTDCLYVSFVFVTSTFLMSPTTNSSSCTIWMLRSICLSGFNGSISYRYRVSTGSKCAQSPPRYSTFYNYIITTKGAYAGRPESKDTKAIKIFKNSC